MSQLLQENNMPKVYIVNNGGHDYEDATRFGELIFCTERVIKRDNTSQMFRELSDAMADAEPKDYILISSLTSLVAIATGIMAARFGEVHFLIYENGHYISRDVIFD